MSHVSAARSSRAARGAAPASGRAGVAGLAVVLVASAVVLAPRRAEARAAGVDRQRVAVVRLAFSGAVPEAARDLFAERLVEGLAAAQFEVLSGPVVRQRLAAAAAEVSDCRAGGCFVRAASTLGVAFLVLGSVEEHEKTYDITLELVHGRSGATIGTNRERCEICGVEEAGEKVGLAASALRARLEALARAPARFIIRSHPVGARVTVDGDDAGRTPLDRELVAGVHKLEIRAPGYDPLDRTVTAVSGVDETLDLDLVPLPTRFPYRVAGWSALLSGAAVLAAGIWGVAADGSEVSCAVSSQVGGHCPRLYDTARMGAALVGIGAVAITLGGTWIYFGLRGSPRQSEVAPRAAGLTIGRSF